MLDSTSLLTRLKNVQVDTPAGFLQIQLSNANSNQLKLILASGATALGSVDLSGFVALFDPRSFA
jgi:hypothetical protein